MYSGFPKFTVGWVCLMVLASAAPWRPRGAGGAEGDGGRMAYLENGVLKIGVDLDRGGSIGFLSDVETGNSVINIHDFGRWVGQSYYSGPRPFGNAHRSWKDWPWNPVSAGDVYGNPSKLIETKNDGQSLYVKSIPMQWALNNTPGDCKFETWITLDGRTAHVRNRLTNSRRDKTQYPAMDQELPAVYTIGKLHRLVTYTGGEPFANQPVEEIPQPPASNGMPRWANFFATEHWAAHVDDNDWGLGVIHPGVVRFLGGFYGKPNTGGPEDDPTGYIAPVRKEILDQNIVYEYRYSLVLDTLVNIRKEAYRLRPASSLPDYHFQSDRQHWWYENAQDAGYPIEGHLRVKLDQADPQLVGPEGRWSARDAPVLYIRAAYRSRRQFAEVYWETEEKPGFPADQKLRFPVEPDGTFHTYEIVLSQSPTYRGTIRRLRFDPVESGQAGDFVDIEFISVRNDSAPLGRQARP